MGISVRIFDATLALSSAEMATCDPNSIGIIIEDKCHDLCPTYEIVRVPSLSQMLLRLPDIVIISYF